MVVIFNYRKIAKRMLAAGIETETAKRYIELVQRERILWRFAEREMGPHPLRDISFHLPVCVAGETKDIVLLADQMLKAGIPISLHLDGRNRPIGTRLNVLVARLQESTGVVHTKADALSLYREYLTASSLSRSDKPKIARIPDLLRRLAMLRSALERRIDVYIQDNSGRRFAVMMIGKSLRKALRKPRASAVVSFNNDRLRVNGIDVQHRGGTGGGAVVVQRPRLLHVAKRSKATVLLDCKKDHWAVWVDGNGPLVFNYEGMDEP